MVRGISCHVGAPPACEVFRYSQLSIYQEQIRTAEERNIFLNLKFWCLVALSAY